MVDKRMQQIAAKSAPRTSQRVQMAAITRQLGLTQSELCEAAMQRHMEGNRRRPLASEGDDLSEAAVHLCGALLELVLRA
jgi:hypothetical protein